MWQKINSIRQQKRRENEKGKKLQPCIGYGCESLLARVRVKVSVNFQTKLKLNWTMLKLN